MIAYGERRRSSEMTKRISLSATSKPEQTFSELRLFAGQWNAGVDVMVTNLSKISEGPVQFVVPDTLRVELPKSLPAAE